MRRVCPTIIAAAVCLPVANARAEFFAGEPIDGPSADITRLGDLDVGRDGSGAVAYLRRDGAVDHVFVARLQNGVFQPPERLDIGLDAPASQPIVAASDNGRLAVVFVSGGELFTSVRAAGAGVWTAPALIAAGASNPAADMSINGVAYTSFTVGGDVRVARLDRNGTSFTVLPDVLDIDPARGAGDGARRSRVVVSADGTALVAWGEDGGDGRSHVFARRVFDLRLSAAPQDLTLNDFEGRAGRSADTPNLDIEDDSSYAWVVFRQSFDDGGKLRARAIARKLLGSQFEAPVAVDGLGWGGEGVVLPRIDLNGRGEGVATSGSDTSNSAFVSILKDEVFNPGQAVGGGGTAPLTVGTIAESQDRVVAWLQGSGGLEPTGVFARFFDDQPDRRSLPAPGAVQSLAKPEFGAVDPSAGLDAAMNRAGDAVIAWVQGSGFERRLVAATYDRPPASFAGYTTARWRGATRPELAWAPSFDLWGPVTYTIEVDGQAVGTTQDTKATAASIVPDGEHRWRVVATDRHGQQAATPTRLLRVDATAPTVTFRVKGVRRRGRAIKVLAKASDVIPPGQRASGVKFVRIDFGDGSRVVQARAAEHRYLRGGAFTVRVSATDVAGNSTVQTRRIRVKRK